MDGGTSSDSDVSGSWVLLDQAGAGPEMEPSPSHEYLDLVELSSVSKQLDQMHRSCEMLSSSLTSSGRPVIAESVLEKAQSIYDIVLLDSELQEELLRNHDSNDVDRLSDTDSVDVLFVESQFKDMGFETDEISVISETELDHPLALPVTTQRHNRQTGSLRRRRKKPYVAQAVDSADNLSSCNEDVRDRPQFNSNLQAPPPTTPTLCPEQRRVYRHYRNNMANTLLSLTAGLIFTGVACVALGHFLGVHDAERTAGEMMDALRRLQMENLILQSKLSQISRAFFRLESSSKPVDAPSTLTNTLLTSADKVNMKQKPAELTMLKESQDKPSDQTEKTTTTKTDKEIGKGDAEERGTAWPKSIRALAELNHSLDDYKYLREDHRQAVGRVSQSLQGRFAKLKLLDNHKVGHFEELDAKIFSVVTKLSKELYKTNGNVDNALKKLTKFDKRLYERICKNWKDFNGDKKYCDSKEEGPDLNVFQWYPEEEKPQAEDTHATGNDEDNLQRHAEDDPRVNADPVQEDDMMYAETEGKEKKVPNTEETGQVNPSGKEEVEERKINHQNPESGKQNSLIHSRNPNLRGGIENSLESGKEKVAHSQETNNKPGKVMEAERKTSAYYSKTQNKVEKKRGGAKRSERDRGNSSKSSDSQNHQRMRDRKEKVKPERKEKLERNFHKKKEMFWSKTIRKGYDALKNLKDKLLKAHHKSFMRKLEEWAHHLRAKKWRAEGNHKNKEDLDVIVLKSRGGEATQMEEETWGREGPQCVNVTGEWMYKWAEGREQCRRHQRISDWQFDRAKARGSLRGDSHYSWQFSRSVGREQSRGNRRGDFSTDTFTWI